MNGVLSPLLLLVLALTTAALHAQTNGQPSRLAIITESAAFSTVADLLTVELSAKPQLQVLERTEIEKVYREQQLSAVNRDYVKLGQVLGADGLLLMVLTADGTNQFLSARLVAVKPGVVLENLRTPWPVPNAPGWARWVANHFTPLLPKLSVAAKDAIPISVVNLRSAVRSVEAQQLERQLTVLLIERLTREPELFVLERRRMDLLSAEKELQGQGESAFWNGSYLLDGVIDRDGYSKDTVTIHAQLAPPKGGAPVPLEVRGKRATPVEVADGVANRVNQGLKVQSRTSWSDTDEAARYAEEAEWALKWGMLEQAQAAADSAWALGKRDMASALARVKAYAAGAVPDTGGYEFGEYHNRSDDDSYTDGFIRSLERENPDRVAWARNGDFVLSSIVRKPPQKQKVDQARSLLELYLELNQIVAVDKLVRTHAWYQAGVDVLTVASQVLQHFQIAPKAQQPVADNLAELRAQSRRVAAWISESPAGEVVTPPNESRNIDEAKKWWEQKISGNAILRCRLNWGYLWQERPEDAVALYRELLSKTDFGVYARRELFSAGFRIPPLAAWNTRDRSRLLKVWEEFAQEAAPPRPAVTTNDVADSLPPELLRFSETNRRGSWSGIVAASFEEQKAFLRTNAPYDFLKFQPLLFRPFSKDQVTELLPLIATYKSNLVAQTNGKTGIERARVMGSVSAIAGIQLRLQVSLNQPSQISQSMSSPLPPTNTPGNYERQKAFLATNAPFEQGFAALFMSSQFSKEQAEELRPLFASYKAHLLAQTTNSPQVKWSIVHNIESVEGLEQRLYGAPSSDRPMANPTPGTDVLLATRFFPIPQDSLKLDAEKQSLSGWLVLLHQVHDDRLWLDLRYQNNFLYYHENGSGWKLTNQAAWAALNLRDLSWEIIRFPEAEGTKAAWTPQVEGGATVARGFGVPSRMLWNTPSARFTISEHAAVGNGSLFIGGPDYLRTYDLKTRKWETQNAPWQAPSAFLVMDQRAFAANVDTIFELLDGTRETRLLASCRRRPTASALDSFDAYPGVKLAPGPAGSLRAIFDRHVYSWDGQDWSHLLTVTNWQRIIGMDICEDATLLKFSLYGEEAGLWRLPHNVNRLEFCLADNAKGQLARASWRAKNPGAAALPAPSWTSPANLAVQYAAATTFQSNLLVLVEHCGFKTYGEANRPIADERDGQHADLLFFEHGDPNPVIVPLKFVYEKDLPVGSIYRWGVSARFNRDPSWLILTAEWLLLGQDDLPGFWAIPRTELDAAIAKERARMAASPESPRRLGLP